jgi:hypothetical protein
MSRRQRNTQNIIYLWEALYKSPNYFNYLFTSKAFSSPECTGLQPLPAPLRRMTLPPGSGWETERTPLPGKRAPLAVWAQTAPATNSMKVITGPKLYVCSIFQQYLKQHVQTLLYWHIFQPPKTISESSVYRLISTAPKPTHILPWPFGDKQHLQHTACPTMLYSLISSVYHFFFNRPYYNTHTLLAIWALTAPKTNSMSSSVVLAPLSWTKNNQPLVYQPTTEQNQNCIFSASTYLLQHLKQHVQNCCTCLPFIDNKLSVYLQKPNRIRIVPSVHRLIFYQLISIVK